MKLVLEAMKNLMRVIIILHSSSLKEERGPKQKSKVANLTRNATKALNRGKYVPQVGSEQLRN